MIGQENLKNVIEEQINTERFPRFSIFVGPRGSGKKQFGPYIAGLLLANYVKALDTKIDTIREIINNAYKVTDTTVYFIPDADSMSVAAKNAMLKVIEEPPNNVYFIMSLEDENNTLETIRNRGTVFHMDRYTRDEIWRYYDAEGYLRGETSDIVKIVIKLCGTPGEVDLLVANDITELYEYAQKVVDNIAKVSLANAFKIVDKIDIKGDGNGFDLKLFWKAFSIFCLEKAIEGFSKYRDGANITQPYINDLRIRGINKTALFDLWVMEVREAWM